jgi:hypothetical protein
MTRERASRLVLAASFVIWVIYGTLAGFGQWPAAVVVGLFAAIALVLFARRACSVKLMDLTVLAFFLLATTATFLVPSNPFRTLSAVIIWTLYAGGAWTSIALRRPFTEQYASETVAPERWHKPAFRRSNLVISSVWGTAFLINLVIVAAALDPRFKSIFISAMLPIVTLAAASLFTSRYVRMVRARAS